MEEVYLEKSTKVYNDGGNLLIKEVSEALYYIDLIPS